VVAPCIGYGLESAESSGVFDFLVLPSLAHELGWGQPEPNPTIQLCCLIFFLHGVMLSSYLCLICYIEG
jgi:hypothetical protein